MSLSNKEVLDLARKHLMGNVKRYDLSLARGQGMKVWDADGKEYLDFLGGIATNALGHAPESLAAVIAEQARTLVHVSNYFYSEPLARLAEFLTRASGLDKAFFGNSGAEANEAAIKLARKYNHDKYGPDRYGIITALDSFHGRTMAAIAATGQEKVKHGFEPLPPGFLHVPFGDLEALKRAVVPGTGAIMLEPVQGEGGVCPAPAGYLEGVAELCRQKDILFILDEIQTGLGRTGKAFAFEHFGVKPDILTLAKPLGGGLSVGAMLARDEVAAAFTPGSHSTTMGGSPLAMAAGLAMVQTILAPEFLARVEETGRYFKSRLEALVDELGPGLAAGVRGLGLLLALNLTRPSPPVVEEMFRRGFIINATAGTVLRFVPPLIVDRRDIDLLIAALREAVKTVYP